MCNKLIACLAGAYFTFGINVRLFIILNRVLINIFYLFIYLN